MFKNLFDNNQLNSLSALDHPSMLMPLTEDSDEISLVKLKHVVTKYASSLVRYRTLSFDVCVFKDMLIVKLSLCGSVHGFVFDDYHYRFPSNCAFSVWRQRARTTFNVRVCGQSLVSEFFERCWALGTLLKSIRRSVNEHCPHAKPASAYRLTTFRVLSLGSSLRPGRRWAGG